MCMGMQVQIWHYLTLYIKCIDVQNKMSFYSKLMDLQIEILRIGDTLKVIYKICKYISQQLTLY